MLPEKRYPLASPSIFWTIQGEGHLRGFQMAFVRLGGCSVGCAGCDTNYKVTHRADGEDIALAVSAVSKRSRDAWVWITGGEPGDHDLRPLLSALKARGFSTAVATSGVKRVVPPVDWLSVSPHSADPGKFQQRYGSELKLTDGLNGIELDTWYAAWPDESTDFLYRYVQPLWKDGQEDPASLARCMAFLDRHPTWALSRQDHKHWSVP